MTGIDESTFPPPGIDLSHPSVARIYDYYLGGTTNWEIDRQFADRLLVDFPILKPIARANRMFLHRVVRYLVNQGIRQFVDIGSGVPTMG
ncbi:MAG: SAM-dependent methyltransferase, partial [Pseudonocardiaceae bacterium]